MHEPLVSVVLPVYNGEKYLAEAIDSILNQTYINFEFIIINDGSVDNSLEIIKSYEDQRIVLISRENRGLIASLNEGIQKAKGKYIARMDADDISMPKRLEKQVYFMENNLDIGISGSWVEIFGEVEKNKVWKLSTQDSILKIKLLFAVPFAHPSVIIRKSIMENFLLSYDGAYIHAEDYKLWVDFSTYAKMANIPKVLLKYRYLETSISRREDQLENTGRYKILKSIYSILLEKLNIINTERENQMHFDLLKNERIMKSSFSVIDYETYLMKLIQGNKYTNIYHQTNFYEVIGKKYLSVLFLKKSMNILNVNYSLVFYGISSLIKDKIL